MIKGDHLTSARFVFDHHGLYVGNGEVIHYPGFSEGVAMGEVEKTTLEKFEAGHGSEVKNHLISLYDAEERVDRAFSEVGQDSYNLIFNNCEHFVNWCFNGLKTSTQVNNVAAGALVTINECDNLRDAVKIAIESALELSKAIKTKRAEEAIVSAALKSAAITSEYANTRDVAITVSKIAQEVSRLVIDKPAQEVVTSFLAKSIASSPASSYAGVTAAATVFGLNTASTVTATTFVGVVGMGTLSTVALPFALKVT